MTAALGPAALSLLLPSGGRDHPVTTHALRRMPQLAGRDRADVTDGLLAGPLLDGPVPRAVVVDAVAEDQEWDRATAGACRGRPLHLCYPL